MPVSEIKVFPDPTLRMICPETDPLKPGLKELLEDLNATLESRPGCVGIASPQIGILERLVVIDASRYRTPVPNHGRITMVNPIIESSDGNLSGREDCLSLPDYTANIRRTTRAKVRYEDEAGTRTIETQGFEAVVI